MGLPENDAEPVNDSPVSGVRSFIAAADETDGGAAAKVPGLKLIQ